MSVNPEFPSWRSYWSFARAVLSERRYIHSAEVLQFLDTVRETSRKRIATLTVVDCAGDRSSKIYLSAAEPSPAEREAAVWSDINKSFSTPVTPTDDHAAYVPTQVLAELFRSMDFDGIAYKSSVSGGTNVALFRLDDAEMTGSGLFSVRKVAFEFSQSR